MKLFDFMILIKKRKKLVIWVILISFVSMLIFTVFFNNENYEITATAKLDSNILLTTSTIVDKSEKTYNDIDLKLNELDDKSAIEYIQNNKSFYNHANMVDYQQVITNISSKESMISEVNSYAFKSYLINNKVITRFDQINIVEQTESLAIRIISDNPERTKQLYNNILKYIPKYVESRIDEKLNKANTSIQSLIKNDTEKADSLIKEYIQLRDKTQFKDITSINKGTEILNSVSNISHSINENSVISNKFKSLMSSDISPDLMLKNVDFSGLKFAKTLVSYIVIEIIASVLISFLAVFITECHTKIKVHSK